MVNFFEQLDNQGNKVLVLSFEKKLAIEIITEDYNVMINGKYFFSIKNMEKQFHFRYEIKK